MKEGTVYRPRLLELNSNNIIDPRIANTPTENKTKQNKTKQRMCPQGVEPTTFTAGKADAQTTRSPGCAVMHVPFPTELYLYAGDMIKHGVIDLLFKQCDLYRGGEVRGSTPLRRPERRRQSL